jgi:hypothetical protein
MTVDDRGSAGKDEHSKIARAVVRELDPEQRKVLAEYTASLVLLRAKDLPTQTKVLDSIDLTADPKVLGVLTKGSGRLLAKHAWKDRSWPARIGLSAAALASILTAGQGAGIALLGTAIGVPLWIVFGSGGAFAGELLDEIDRVSAGDPDSAGDAEAGVRAPPLDTSRQIRVEAESLDVDEIVEGLESEFSGEADAKRIDEELGIEPDTLEAVRERLEQLKEEIRAGRNPSQLLQKWLLRRKQ